MVKCPRQNVSRSYARLGRTRMAHEKSVEGVAQFVGYEKLTTIDELRSGMTFPAPHPFRNTSRSVSTSCSQSLSRSFGVFQKLSVSISKRKHDREERKGYKRSRSNSQTSKLSQHC